ncbi:chemotaxis protein CheB [Hyalangium minutum]|uniref:protein-glutamate methylesterase n=1 Tax=Hyalangium minutum TaxID=394096 RepID=A0A085WQD9_9BACT|nr:chemotaxis protein CheB [Hyalangium minutum]KFE69902.1 Chemotaxis response regulator protein-glutamate methylesterase CheB [Hyalangium minutum]
MSSTIRVLIADDSPTMLKMYAALLSSAADIQVVGTAKDGAEALELARTLQPDVITLDVRMPRMDGIEASSRIMTEAPSRILVISGAVDAEMSFKALQAGALEVMPKPRPNLEGLANFGVKLIHIIRTMAELPVSQRQVALAPAQAPSPVAPAPQGGRVTGFGLVASTGGPPALCHLLSLLPPQLPYPIFIAQHVSVGFTAGLCQWLGAASSLQLEVAQTGVRPQPGYVYLPPDGHQFEVTLAGDLQVEPIPVGKASLGDTLLSSLALAYGDRAAGAVLTGMGSDGAAGLLAIRKAGGRTFAQSPESCVVPGMPEAALRSGATDQMLSLEALAAAMRSFTGAAPVTPAVRN